MESKTSCWGLKYTKVDPSSPSRLPERRTSGSGDCEALMGFMEGVRSGLKFQMLPGMMESWIRIRWNQMTVNESTAIDSLQKQPGTHQSVDQIYFVVRWFKFLWIFSF